MKFKVGDLVAIRSSDRFKALVGLVENIYKTGYYSISFSNQEQDIDNGAWGFHFSEIRKVCVKPEYFDDNCN